MTARADPRRARAKRHAGRKRHRARVVEVERRLDAVDHNGAAIASVIDGAMESRLPASFNAG